MDITIQRSNPVQLTAIRPSSLQTDHVVRGDLEALYLMDLERRNLIRNSESLTSAWSHQANGAGTITVTDDYADGPPGTGRAARIQMNLNGGTTVDDQSSITQTIPGIPQNTVVTHSVWLKTNDGSNKNLRFSTNGSDPTPVRVTGQWQRFTTTGRRTDDAIYAFRLNLRGTFNTSDSADILFAGAQTNYGSEVLPYVPTTNKQALYDYSGNGRHAIRGSLGTAFICPVGRKHLWGNGRQGGGATAPSSSDNTPSSQFEVRCNFKFKIQEQWGTLVSKDGGSGDFGWSIRLKPDTSFDVYLSADGVNRTFYGSDSLLDNGFVVGDDIELSVIVNTNPANMIVRVRHEGETDWVILFSEATTENSLYQTDGPVGVGNVAGGSLPYNGVIYSAKLYISGDLVADFNPDRDAHGDIPRFTSSTTGEVWSILQAYSDDTNDFTWIGGGAKFDGVDDYAIADFPDTLEEFTLFAAGVIPTAANFDQMVSLSSRTHARFATLGTRDHNGVGKFHASIVDASNQQNLFGSSLTFGPKVLMATAEALGPVRFYEEGTLMAEGTTNATEWSIFDILVVGGVFTSGNFVDAFNGTIPIVALYSRVLTSAEAQQNYRAAKKWAAMGGLEL